MTVGGGGGCGFAVAEVVAVAIECVLCCLSVCLSASGEWEERVYDVK